MRHDLVGTHNCQMPPCFEPNFPYEIERSRFYLLLREDTLERKVYHLPHQANSRNCKMEEYVLFDFSLSVGDSLNECLRNRLSSPNEPGSGFVDSISMGNRFGRELRIFNTFGVFPLVGLPYMDKLELMEGIGLQNHGFFPATQDGLVDVCYGDFTICNILSSSKKVEVNTDFEIAPNPAFNYFRIITDSKIENVELFDGLGNRVNRTNASEVDVSNLPSGMYFLKVLFENESIGISKIINQP